MKGPAPAWLQSTSPLPVHPSPLPWEDLASLVSRVASGMGYNRARWLLFPRGLPHQIRSHNLLLLHNEQDGQVLQRLLFLDESALYRLTLHRFASVLQVPAQPESSNDNLAQYPLLKQGAFAAFCQSTMATKICPVCLEEGIAYGRLYWSLQPAVVCLQHQQLLLDCCPTCAKAIPVLRSKLSRCPYCQGVYQQVQKEPIRLAPWLITGQSLLFRHLGITDDKGVQFASEEPGGWFAELRASQYFQLLDLCRHILGHLEPNDPFLQAASGAFAELHGFTHPRRYRSSQEWGIITSMVSYIFASWPTNYYEWLDALQRVSWKSPRLTGIHRDFGPFYSQWLYGSLHEPAFDVLREAFEEYLCTQYSGGYVNQRLLPFRKKGREEDKIELAYVTQRQAIHILGVTAKTLNTLIERGVLVAIKQPYGGMVVRTLCLVEKASLDQLQKEWQDLLTRDQVAAILGIGLPALRALAAAKWLCPIYGSKRDRDDVWLYQRKEIEQFVEKLRKHAGKKSGITEDVIPLATVFRSLGSGMSLVESLTSIIHGELQLLEVPSEEPWFNQLVVSVFEVERFRHLRETRRKVQGWLTPAEVAIHLGISQHFLRWLVQQGFLSCERRCLDGGRWRVFIHQAALEDFHQKYLLAAGAAKKLQISLNALEHLISAGALHPLSRNRFSRLSYLLLLEEVERFATAPPS